MNTRQGPITRTAERFLGPQGAPGDERERAVAAQAASFGLTLAIYVNLVVALIAALLGALALPVVLLMVLAVPSWAAIGFARRRGVDMSELAEQVKVRRSAPILVLVFGGMFLIAGAMAITVFTGHGLVDLPAGELIGPEASGAGASLVKGTVIGALVGAPAGLVAIVIGFGVRRRRAANVLPDDQDDEDDHLMP